MATGRIEERRGGWKSLSIRILWSRGMVRPASKEFIAALGRLLKERKHIISD